MNCFQKSETLVLRITDSNYKVFLGLQNTSTASLQRGKTPPNECPGYDSE